jgi:hypothetical protein
MGVHFHVTLLVNSKTLWQSALKMTVEDHERPTDALNETSSQRLESGARRINQQSLMWPGPYGPSGLGPRRHRRRRRHGQRLRL